MVVTVTAAAPVADLAHARRYRRTGAADSLTPTHDSLSLPVAVAAHPPYALSSFSLSADTWHDIGGGVTVRVGATHSPYTGTYVRGTVGRVGVLAAWFEKWGYQEPPPRVRAVCHTAAARRRGDRWRHCCGRSFWAVTTRTGNCRCRYQRRPARTHACVCVGCTTRTGRQQRGKWHSRACGLMNRAVAAGNRSGGVECASQHG